MSAGVQDRPVVFVPCPIPPDGFAGWAIQVRRIAERNSDTADFRFLFNTAPGAEAPGAMGLALAALRYAWQGRRAITREAGVVLFPCFFLHNVLLARLLPGRIPYVLRISGGELDKGNPVTYRLRLAMIRRARHVIALNRGQFEQLGRIGVAEDRRTLIPVSVAPEFAPPTPAQRAEARAALGLAPEDWVIGSVGLLSARKQQRTLIEAVAQLDRPDAVVVLCGPEGGGNEADPAYAAACRADAARLGVRLIMTGRRADVRAILWALDVFALPSLQEGMPNALLEALACGLPCVGSDIPGIRQLLDNGAHGEIFPPGDAHALAHALDAARRPVDRDPVAEYRSDIVDRNFMKTLQD